MEEAVEAWPEHGLWDGCEVFERTDDALSDAAHDTARHENVLGHWRGRQRRSQVLR